jgi:hypothetical protein
MRKVEVDKFKLIFLACEYPKKTIHQLAEIFQVSPIDLNHAAWRAQNEGYIIINEKDGKYAVSDVSKEIHKTSGPLNFGEQVEYLTEAIPYVLDELGKKETDMEETYFSNWTQGYQAQDVIIATKLLIRDKIIDTYEIKDKDNTYTFYTSYANRGNKWGKKQFKDKKKLK